MIRKTYVEINEDVLQNNVNNIVENYPDYKYYIGVVKNNAYHHGWHIVNALIDGGVNYLAVSSAEEAINVRKYNKNIPVLCMEIIPAEAYDVICENNITITVESTEYLEQIKKQNPKSKIIIHLKIDTGMNRLGFCDKNDIEKAVSIIKDYENFELEGIYTHLSTTGVLDNIYDKQIENFQNLCSNIDLDKIPIVHIGRSLTLVQHDKPNFCSGIRIGIAMYGFSQSINSNGDKSLISKLKDIKHQQTKAKLNISETHTTNNLKLNTAFCLYSTIMSKREVKAGDIVGYGGLSKIENPGYIYTIPIGYADGVDINFGTVVIDNQKCKILSDCMDMIMVYSNKDFKIGSKVEIFGDEISVSSLCQRLGINSYHLFTRISNRVSYIHKNKDKAEEIQY